MFLSHFLANHLWLILLVTLGAGTTELQRAVTQQKADSRIKETQSHAELVVQAGHSGEISSLAFSRDGNLLATAGDDTVKLWSMKTGRIIRTLGKQSGWVNAIAFSPDDQILASAGGDTIILWDMTTLREKKILKGHRDSVSSVAFSPDGMTLASGSSFFEKQIKLWNVESGNLIRSLSGHNGAIHSLLFSLDGKTLASGGGFGDATLKLWNVVTFEELITLKDHTAGIWSIALSPDGELLASGDQDGKIKLWEFKTRKLIRTLSGHNDEINSVAFSPDGKMLASGSDDLTIKFWDVKTKQELKTLRGHTDTVRAVRFSWDGNTLASGSEDKKIKLWNVSTGKEMKTLAGQTDYIWSVAFSPVTRTLAIGNDDGKVKLWNIESREKLKTIKAHSDYVISVTFSRNGRLLASAGGRTIKLWDTTTAEEVRFLNGHRDDVNAVAFSPNGETVASTADDGTIRLWDVATGRDKILVTGIGTMMSIAFSPDGEVVSGMVNSQTKLWSVRTGQEIQNAQLLNWALGEAMERPKLNASAVRALSKFGEINLVIFEKNQTLGTLIPLEDDWVVVTENGWFDTNKSLDEIEGLHWIVSDDPLSPAPLEIFMRDYYEPKLLPRLLKCVDRDSCDKEFSKLPNIADLNRVQPGVRITKVSEPDQSHKVKVTVEVEKAQVAASVCKMKKCETGAFDLRLFRNGQLVGGFPENGREILVAAREYEIDNIDQRRELWREAMKINLDGKTGKQSHTFEVQLPLNQNTALLEFTAYAFNEDRVKSNTARWNNNSESRTPKVNLQKPKVYIVSVGVNASQNKEWELQYAAKDAREMGRILGAELSKVGGYEIVNISLISDMDASGVLTANDATKGKIKTVLALLAGNKLDPEQERLFNELKRSRIPVAKIHKVTPDDAVLISFSSHGYADNKGIFYLFPFDIGQSDRKLEIRDILPQAISSDELSLWLMDIDGGEMAMIIDACHAAASVENREFKPGPMGSRGLGQLAYDKRISILTATQATELAFEAGGKLNQGLLSFALLQDGLEKSLADFKSKPDGKIFLREWLEYGETRVPQLYDDLRNNRLKGIPRSERLTKILNEQAGYQQRPSLFDFSRQSSSMIISVTTPQK